MVLPLPFVLPAAGIAAWAVTKYHLNGADLSGYDMDTPATFNEPPAPAELQAFKDYFHEYYIRPAKEASGSRADKLQARRERFDQKGLNRSFEATFVPDSFRHGTTTISGEWVQVADADPARRILYIHGGAGTVGSAVSHRAITTNLARRTGASVFAVNYRLMPEHHRMASVYDVRAAYRWIIDHGPHGVATVKKLAVGGDSFGGNLALSLSNWVRDGALRPIDAVFCLSPATDTTMSGESVRRNMSSDLMLGTLFKPYRKVPRQVLLWALWSMYKLSPSDPAVSPVFDDLSGLPPTLLHASTSEILYDDAVRFAAKAQQSGSPVELQTWVDLPHVWHAFDQIFPQAGHAFDQIAEFLEAQSF